MRRSCALSRRLIRIEAGPAFLIDYTLFRAVPDRSPAFLPTSFEPRSHRGRGRHEEGDARSPFPPPRSRSGADGLQRGSGRALTILLSEGEGSPKSRRETRQTGEVRGLGEDLRATGSRWSRITPSIAKQEGRDREEVVVQ